MLAMRGVVLLLVLDLGTAYAERYEDPVRGFSIEVPAGWHPFSQEEMERMQQVLRNSGQLSQYIAGFKADPGPVQMPYLLVEWLPNAMYAVQGQMTGEQIGRVCEMTRLKNEESAVSPPEFTVDMARKQAVYAFEIDLHGMRICTLGLMQFGRHGIYRALYYARTMDELAEGGVPRQTVTSLQLAPEVTWNEAALESSRVERINVVVRWVLMGAAVAWLLALIALAMRKRRLVTP